MCAADLDEAIGWQNSTGYGLTGGIHSLDPAETRRWVERVEVGNAYVNRTITGAIVRRQPFGGWSGSVVGPGAKAGGPNTVPSLGTIVDPAPAGEGWLAAALESDDHWWNHYFSIDHDPTGHVRESNVLRYRRRRGVGLRVSGDAEPLRVRRTLAAAERCGVGLDVSVHPSVAGSPELGRVETDERFVERLATSGLRRVRWVGTVPDAAWVAAGNDVTIIDAPVVGTGRVELLWYLREKAVSTTTHRFGNPL